MSMCAMTLSGSFNAGASPRPPPADIADPPVHAFPAAGGTFAVDDFVPDVAMLMTLSSGGWRCSNFKFAGQAAHFLTTLLGSCWKFAVLRRTKARVGASTKDLASTNLSSRRPAADEVQQQLLMRCSSSRESHRLDAGDSPVSFNSTTRASSSQLTRPC